jgi:hypothetical protein
VQETAKAYETGKALDIKYVDGNSIVWYSITVPPMSAGDIQGNTYNNIDLDGFTIGTYTSDILMNAGNSWADGDTWYPDANGTNPTFTYQLSNSGADNTGILNSYDPVYGQNLKVCLVVTISGDGYEHVLPQGFDDKFTLGSTTYAIKYYDASALTKWKVGSNYMLGFEGTQVKSFSFNMAGMSGTDAPTIQMTAYAYADPAFAKNNGGDLGETATVIAEQTLLTDMES